MLLLNVQGLTTDKVGLIESEYLSQIKSLAFLCLTETWLTRGSVSAFHFPGYRLISHYERSIHKHGGVAVWCLERLDVVPLSLESYCVELDFEICGCEFEFSWL